MRMAEKLLRKHNLAQADVLDEDHVPEALKGGSSVVHLRSTAKGHRPCVTKQWMHTLAAACTRNFECSYYFTAHTSKPPICDFTFYVRQLVSIPRPLGHCCHCPLALLAHPEVRGSKPRARRRSS